MVYLLFFCPMPSLIWMHSAVRGSVVFLKPVSQSLLLQLREEKKKELNQGRKGERSDTRGGTQNTTLTPTLRETVDRDMRKVHGVGLLTDKYADCFL